MNKPFQFKKFTVNQDQCAMKIGTDAVLLGAWAPIDKRPFSILDIGSGTGVLSLMLAQRSHAEVIDALEIDDLAYEQCVENFETSAWSDRLFCYHASLEEFADEIDDTYDLIVCNPPFYYSTPPLASLTEGENQMSDARRKARFQDAMPFEHLLENVKSLLSKDGMFSVVIPFSEENRFITLGLKLGLFLKKKTHVRGTPLTEIKRSLLTFSFIKTAIETSVLVIETSRHHYTEDYINLTKDFYLKM